MNKEISPKDIAGRLADISKSQSEIMQTILGMGTLIGDALNAADSVNRKLKEVQSHKAEPTPGPKKEEAHVEVRTAGAGRPSGRTEPAGQPWMANINEALNSARSQGRQIGVSTAVQGSSDSGKNPVNGEVPGMHLKTVLGSIENMEQRLEQKIDSLMKESRVSGDRSKSGAGEATAVDLSKLFVHGQIESNLNDSGIVEVSSKASNKSLEKILRMKEGA